jgi:hypothetical protein
MRAARHQISVAPTARPVVKKTTTKKKKKRKTRKKKLGVAGKARHMNARLRVLFRSLGISFFLPKKKNLFKIK